MLEQEMIAQRLEETVTSLIGAGVRYFGAGGARGFDTLAAQTILKLQREYPQIKLILVLPCLSQTRGWRDEDIKVYERIKAAANKITYTSENYTQGCMHKRNRHLVDHSSVCAVLTEPFAVLIVDLPVDFAVCLIVFSPRSSVLMDF